MSDLKPIIAEARQAGSWLAYRRAARAIRESSAKADDGGDVTTPARLRTALLSSFTIEPLADYLAVEAADDGLLLETFVGGYNQFNQEILDPAGPLRAFDPELTFLLVELESLAGPLDASHLATEPAAQLETGRQAAESLAALARSFTPHHGGTLLVANFMATPGWPLHLVHDARRAVAQAANGRLAELLAGDSRVRVLDLDALASYHGYREALAPQTQALARQPLSEPFLLLLARRCAAEARAARGLVRKCLVLDLDNTLWGGIVGEDGYDGLHLGPEAGGREFLDFQQAALELFHQGVILAVNSKNNFADAVRVIREHPRMLLREEHFASLQINWDPKPTNMERIAREVGIGLESLVFFDDSPVERELMRQMWPQVAVIDVPANPALYSRTLRETCYFAQPALTDEDCRRGQMYAEERRREEVRQQSTTMSEFLRSLQTVVTIRRAGPGDLKRAAQLSQRTNQFNLTTRRYQESDLAAMMADARRQVYILQASDRFGDNGLVGLAVTAAETCEQWRVETFLMSCRVIGRQIEDALVDRLLREARAAGARRLVADYRPTKKNGLVATFWEKMGFAPLPDESAMATVGGSAAAPVVAEGVATQWYLDLARFEPRRFEYLKIVEPGGAGSAT